MSFFSHFFTPKPQKALRAYHKRLEQINALDEVFNGLSDGEILEKSQQIKAFIQSCEHLENALNQSLNEAFALVRQAAWRTLEMRHFDAQILGGLALFEGRIAEMSTGEGKTLVATLAVYLKALSGKGVHVVTVNDYLAQRDAEWMGTIYRFLGLSVGVIGAGMSREERQKAYQCDITYGTNNEFGFDYLRDNMAFVPQDRVMRGLNFAVVDEVDSILIDEARTPLVISGALEQSSTLYQKLTELAKVLEPSTTPQAEEGLGVEPVEPDGDYTLDEKARQAFLTDAGFEKAEVWLRQNDLLNEAQSLFDLESIALLHQLNACLRAKDLLIKNVHYMVKGGEVLIIDEFTGRAMAGRRWSDGLHQALEAKERLTIKPENVTLASITYQNYFRLYQGLCGMTGTASTEAEEFAQIYGLEVVSIPPHKPCIRKDHPDRIYLKQADKLKALIQKIKESYDKGQPILVGTTSIESSELISQLLDKQNVPHSVLNARQHEQEAHIIANAGCVKAVTVATNMAGRGTDIVLGGSLKVMLEEAKNQSQDEEAVKVAWQEQNQKVKSLGGLLVVGSERHESRRIDNQLRGRSGRQGDPGESLFFLSLEDPLMRIFASNRISSMMEKLGLKGEESIEHAWITKAIANAQKRVEGHNFDIRKNLLEYDDVANDQRRVIYEQRDKIMNAQEVSDLVSHLRQDCLSQLVEVTIGTDQPEEFWQTDTLSQELKAQFNLDFDAQALAQKHKGDSTLIAKAITDVLEQAYSKKTVQVGKETMTHLEKVVMLQKLDQLWKEHLASMDFLRKGVSLRGYANKNPKQEYKREAFELFEKMLDNFKLETISFLSKVRVRTPQEVEQMEQEQRQSKAKALDKAAKQSQQPHNTSTDYTAQNAFSQTPSPLKSPVANQAKPSAMKATTLIRKEAKVGRNQPCPCGSGKKYKHCHG